VSGGERTHQLLFDVHRTYLFDEDQTMTENAAALPPEHAQDLAQIDVLTVLQALSDPVRLGIVRQLAERQCMCGQLDVPVGKSTASHHLKTLAKAGVTAEREEGTAKYLRLRREELEERFPGLLESVLRA
jgi:DNA-binding transcriptional ArsR family regulator